MKVITYGIGAALMLCTGAVSAAGLAGATPQKPAAIKAVSSTPSAKSASYVARTERGRLAQQIVRKWSGYVYQVYETTPNAWARAMGDTFAQADISNLRQAAKRQTFEAMSSTLGGRAISDQQAITALAKSDGSKLAVKSIGSALGDLTYTPVNPCRIVDTRLAVGALSPNIPRHLLSSGANFTAQGGSNTNCAIPADPSALALNVTILGATGGPSFIRVYPYATSTDAVAVNYVAGQRISNEVIAKMTRGQPFDFSVISGFGTHIVIDVAGYFMAPAATALECTNVMGSEVSVPANAGACEASPACPAGYTATATLFDNAGGTNGVVIAQLLVDDTGQLEVCGTNTAATAQTYTPGSRCCRIPGR